MRKSYPLAAFVAASFCLAADVSGAEIKGKVIQIQGGTVEVKTNSALLPNPGDQAEIYFKIPGLSEVAHVASGRVSDIAGDSIHVAIDEAAAQIVNGQFVRIASDRPRTRGSFSESRGPASADRSDTAVAPSEQNQFRATNGPRFAEPDPNTRQPVPANGSDTVFVLPEDEPQQTETPSSNSREPMPVFQPWSGYGSGDRNGPVPQSRAESRLPTEPETVVPVDPFALPPVALPPEQDDFQSPNGRQPYVPSYPSQPTPANRSQFRYSPPEESGFPSTSGPRYFGQSPDYGRRAMPTNRRQSGYMPSGQNEFYTPDRSRQFGPVRNWSRAATPADRSDLELVPPGQEEPPSPPLPPVGRPIPNAHRQTTANLSWRGSWLIDGQPGPVARRQTGPPAPATPSETSDDPDDLDETTPPQR
jgi:hypothetical protein